MSEIYFREVAVGARPPTVGEWKDVTDDTKSRRDFDAKVAASRQTLAMTYGEWLADVITGETEQADRALAADARLHALIARARDRVRTIELAREQVERGDALAVPGARLWERHYKVSLGEWRYEALYSETDLTPHPLGLLAAGLHGVCIAAGWKGDPEWLTSVLRKPTYYPVMGDTPEEIE